LLSRRRFLQVGSIAAGASALPTLVDAQEEKKLPEPIAALKAMRGEAQPITLDERRARLERARSLMGDNKLSAILMMEGTSLNYFTGIRWWGGERLFAMVLPAKGEPFYVCPAFEEGRAREQIAKSPDGDKADVRIWQGRKSISPRRPGIGGSGDWRRNYRHRGNGSFRLQRQHAENGEWGDFRECDSGHGWMPHDQKRS